MSAASETTPLVARGTGTATDQEQDFRKDVYDFLEAKNSAGAKYELFMIILILVNVLAFIIGTLFVQEYNKEPWAERGVVCGNVCDALWFGNHEDNGLEVLGIWIHVHFGIDDRGCLYCGVHRTIVGLRYGNASLCRLYGPIAVCAHLFFLGGFGIDHSLLY